MGGVGYHVRRVLAAQWRAAAGLAVTVAMVGGIVLTLAAGVERTASAPDRYEAALGNRFDTGLEQAEGRPLTDELAALPSVRSVVAATFVFGGLVPEGGDAPVEAIVFAGDVEALQSERLDGRLPDPEAPGEFVASESWMELTGAAIGDRFELLTISEESAEGGGFDAEPDGPRVEATLVGSMRGAADVQDDFPMTLFPASLLDEGPIGVSGTPMLVSLEPGADVDDLRAEIAGLPDGDVVTVEPLEPVPDDLREAVSTQANALAVITAIAAFAGLVLVGQVALRQARLSDDRRRSLAALGLTPPQLVGEALGRVAVPIVAGAFLAGGLAFVASGLFPRGLVQRLEPEPGLRLELLVHFVGPILLALGLLAVVGVLLGLRTRARSARTAHLPDRLAARLSQPRAALGLRFAFARSDRERGAVSTPVLGLAVLVVALVASATFAASFADLVHDRERWGQTYDLQTGQGGSERVDDAVQAALLDDPEVTGLTLLGALPVTVEGTPLDVTGYEPVRGEFAIRVLAGRRPAAPDEIALGERAAAGLGAAVDDVLPVQAGTVEHPFRVTGLVVVPGIEGGEGLGEGGVVTAEGFAALGREATLTASGIVVRDGAPDDIGSRLGAAAGGIAVGPTDPPAVIINFRRVRSAPYFVAGLLGLLVLVSIANLMSVGVRQRSRDLAVVRALGADRKWVAGVGHWHALLVVTVVGGISAVVGIAVGRLAFTWRVTDRVGAADDTAVPVLGLLVGLVVLVVVADGVGQLAARWGRRAVARELATE